MVVGRCIYSFVSRERDSEKWCIATSNITEEHRQ
jgi:hypothetical protein